MANDVSYISSITLPGSNNTYYLKDSEAREIIANLNSYTKYLGVTTSNITDGSTTNPVIISGVDVTATNGDIVNKGSKEYIWNGSSWQEFGDMSGLGELAFKDEASDTYTPAGTVTQPTFTGAAKYVHLNKGTATSTGTFTPTGTISATFTGESTEGNIEVSAPSVLTTVDIEAYDTNGGTDIDITPSGTVGNMSATVSAQQTIGEPTPHGVTANGTTPSWTATVAEENLTIGWSAGSMPTLDSNVAITPENAVIVVTPGRFVGTSKYLRITNHRNKLTSTGTFTPSGTVSATFTGSQGNVSVSTTDAVTSAIANGTSTGGNITLTITPAGTVTQPTFTGTQATITVS